MGWLDHGAAPGEHACLPPVVLIGANGAMTDAEGVPVHRGARWSCDECPLVWVWHGGPGMGNHPAWLRETVITA